MEILTKEKNKQELLLNSATELIQAFKDQNHLMVMSAWRKIFSTNILKDVIEAPDELKQLYQIIFETTDDILHFWFFAEQEKSELWRTILFFQEKDLFLNFVMLNAKWLRESGSTRVNDIPVFPTEEQFNQLDYPQKAKWLAKFCVRTDGKTSINYELMANLIPAPLKDFWIRWFLQVYLTSPYHVCDEDVSANRQQAMQDFCRTHENRPIEISEQTLYFLSLFLAAYYPSDVKPFLKTVSQQFPLEKKLAFNFTSSDSLSSSKRDGIIFFKWEEATALYRCINPMLTKWAQQQDIMAFSCSLNYQKQPSKLAEFWSNSKINIKHLDFFVWSKEHMKQHIEQIQKEKLRFLYFPDCAMEMVLRHLSRYRLAQVQATGYGHPTTTGSPNMDFYIGGLDIETQPNQYTERLVLLPGLGVSSEVPPKPTRSRQRPLQDVDLLIMNQSSLFKLNANLFKSWNEILKPHASRATLKLYTGISTSRLMGLYDSMRQYMPDIKIIFNSSINRQFIIDELIDMDLYLDSYPFGGFNTLIEVLASGCPFVTIEGDYARNRFGAAMLRKLKLPEFLIARNYQEYIAAATKLIEDPILRSDLRAQLTRERIIQEFCNTDIAEHFQAAVDWMTTEGLKNKEDRRPVYIEAGQKPIILDKIRT